MYGFEAEISEMSRYLKILNRYVFIFNLVETFLILYAISIFFDLSGVFSLIIGFNVLKLTVMGVSTRISSFIIYTVGLTILSCIISVIRRKKARQSYNYMFSQLEETHPEVEEKLAAAYDNRDKDNIFMQHLDTEVVTDMGDVRLSSFVNTRIIMQIVIISIITFSTVITFGFTGIGFDVPKDATLESLADNITQSPAFKALESLAGVSKSNENGEQDGGQGQGDSSTGAAESDLTGTGGGGVGDAEGGWTNPYGEISIAAQGTQDLDFTIFGGGIVTETPLHDISDITMSQTDVPANFVPQQTTSQSSSNNKPVEYKSCLLYTSPSPRD